MAENGVKTESGVEVSDLEKKIIRQVEYYFGDMNLTRDRFLQQQVKEDDGWVAMETMLKFKRLASLSSDGAVIIEALKKSSAGLMEMNEDGSKIRRCPDKPLPANTLERRENIKERTAYVKGFPTDMTMDMLLEFFESHGPPETIQMRRTATKDFKGSTFIVFKTEEDVLKFLKEERKYKDTPLIKMTKDEYFKMKNEERKTRRDENIQKEEDEKNKKDEEDLSKINQMMKKGAILIIRGLDGNTSFTDMKEFFAESATVAYVEHDRGDSEALLRFEAEGGAQKGWDGVKDKEGKVTLKGCEITGEVLEGDAEFHYWKKRYQSMRDMKGKKRKFARGGRGGRGGRGKWGSRRGGRGRGRDEEEEESSGEESSESETEEPAVKKTKSEPEESAVKKPKSEPEEPAVKKPKSETEEPDIKKPKCSMEKEDSTTQSVKTESKSDDKNIKSEEKMELK